MLPSSVPLGRNSSQSYSSPGPSVLLLNIFNRVFFKNSFLSLSFLPVTLSKPEPYVYYVFLESLLSVILILLLLGL